MISSFFLFCALTSTQAVEVMLNSSEACGVKRYAEASRLVREKAEEGSALHQYVFSLKGDDPAFTERYLAPSRTKIQAIANKNGNPLALFLLSMETNDFNLLKRAAKGENVQALNAIGQIAITEGIRRHQAGAISSNTLDKIFHMSIAYFKKAVAKHRLDANAYINLGTCYLNGFGCEKDPELAVSCWRAAAERGHPAGMDYLSASYSTGNGVKKDILQARIWKMKADALRGDENAEKWLKERK